ncbi:MAG: thioesterase family protein [bacterium]|nr:thioesterase family protein [bacterium]
MARIQIDLPTDFVFKTEIPVRIDDVNIGGHLGHDSIVSLMHEARARFFAAHGWTEIQVSESPGGGSVGIIMADLAVQYLSEAFHGNRLRFQIAARDFSSKGCDLVYVIRLVGHGSDRGAGEVARAKTGIVFFDYQARTPVEIPPRFRALFA